MIQTLPNSVSNPIIGTKGKQIDDEVIIATVDDPWAVFKNAAIKKGVSQDLIQKWQDQLQESEKKGSFAFTVISVLTSAFSK